MYERKETADVSQIEANDRITVHTNTDVVGAAGQPALRVVHVMNRLTGRRTTLPARYVFVFVGAHPSTAWLPPDVLRDRDGYVLTGSDAERALCLEEATTEHAPLPFETSRPEIFAIGDVRSGSTKRMAAAIGEGASVVPMLFHTLSRQRVG